MTALRTSDFGTAMRYIPLETTDDCLIGQYPTLKVLRNYIVVEADNRCLLFDKNDGRFISEIGHAGQDPEAYGSAFSWTDGREAFLYFGRPPDKLVKYDMKGNFCGSVTLTSPSGPASFFLVTDSVIVGYHSELNRGNIALSFFDTEGILQDSLPSLLEKNGIPVNDIARVTVLRKGDAVYGNWSMSGTVIIESKDGKKQMIAPGAATLWQYNDAVRFKEFFTDTVYTVARGKLIPSVAFHTGKWRWPQHERTSTDNAGGRIFIASVSESDRCVFFQCIKGLYADEPVAYNGLYDKNTGETRLAGCSDAIRDDLTDFMPLKSLTMSTSGEFAALVEAGDIMEWMEEHPETAPAFPDDFDEYTNPVVVLISH